MDFAPAYLVGRFTYRFVDFFHHWYVDGSREIAHRFMVALARADRTLAIKITLRHLFEPLYGDYTGVGRVVGLIFRLARIVVGLAVYACIAAVFILAYLAWILVPATLIFYAARSLA